MLFFSWFPISRLHTKIRRINTLQDPIYCPVLPSPRKMPLICAHSPTATVALWGLSISSVDSGGWSMGFSRSSGGWPSPRDHTAQLEETHAWLNALQCHCAKEKTFNQYNRAFHTPTFYLKQKTYKKESYRHIDRQTNTCFSTFSLHTSHISRMKAFCNMESMIEAWNIERVSDFHI